uniref:C3H1-type domain-containing protein n=1 Tax=Panagrolaimus superbus TaxID=310955 RepID=A0A914Z4T7_9BILA
MMPTTTPSPSSPFTHSSSDGSIREETVREVFYRVLSESLKEANKFFCGKTTSWKNPFLYKTTLCVNYTNRSYCRFGVNCWYAHGDHELRCIPESEELPEPTYIKQYLSFLGLPSNTLDQIIQRAYFVASLFTSEAGSKKSSSTESSMIPTRSTSPSLHSPIESHCQRSFSAAVAPPPAPTTFSDSMNPPTQQCSSIDSNNKFLSSLASNGGWGDIESAINGAVNDKEEDESPFGKGYHLFGNSFNLQKSW